MNQLVLKFKTKGGKSASLRVPNVKDVLTSEEVQSLMQLILEKNIFREADQEFKELGGCQMVTTKNIF
ncbi:hypothetical protein ABB02_01669 [Clostridiaceae bacterium JG1575]|nr:hypothetical protein ABB02_01669 [Clostridiaceae bacterium JG1575]